MKFNSGKYRLATASFLVALALAMGARAQVAISVNTTQVVRTVDARMFGLNTANWDGNLNSTATTKAVLKSAGCTSLRFPGGSTADQYLFPASATVSFDTFSGIVTNLGAQANSYVTVNYGGGTPVAASNWVWTSASRHYGIKYWEIGNECYGTWENDTHAVKHDPFTYATNAVAFMTLMRAADPTIKVGLPALPTTGTVNNNWTRIVLTNLFARGMMPDFLVFHDYPEGGGSESDSGLLASMVPGAANSWATVAANMRAEITRDYGTAGTNIELVSTENNSVSSNPGKQSTSLVNGLYLAESTGQILQTEFNSLVWWDFHNGQLTTNNNKSTLYGWRMYGDYGIADPGHANLYPTYYTFKLMQLFARGGDRVVRVTGGTGTLAAYATKRADGSICVLVINKSPTVTTSATISLTGFTPGSTATVYSYGTNEDNAAQTTPNTPAADLQTNSLGITGTTVPYTFPAYSATVLAIPAGSVPPVLSLATVDGGGHFGFQIAGQPGAAYIVETSTDFTNWIHLSTNTLAGGTLQWNDPQPAGPMPMFYRVVLLP